MKRVWLGWVTTKSVDGRWRVDVDVEGAAATADGGSSRASPGGCGGAGSVVAASGRASLSLVAVGSSARAPLLSGRRPEPVPLSSSWVPAG